MKITLKGFRCHIDIEYEFRDGSLILLSGPSGCGKSTIFQAIHWCLYGNLRGIYNNSGESNKCSVTLDFSSFTIYRQGRPSLLRFSYKIQPFSSYEDVIAQQFICQQFGQKDIWKACCYSEQGSRCSLLSGSNSERMELLNRLSFATDDPESCISRIDSELKSVQTQFCTLQIKFRTENNMFGRELNEKSVNPSTIVLIPSLPDLKDSVLKIREELDQLTKVQLEQRHLQGVHQTLIQTLNEKLKTLEELISSTSIDVEEIITSSHVENLRLNLNSATNIHQTLSSSRMDQQHIRGSYQILSQSLCEKSNQLEQMPIVELSEIDSLSVTIELLKNQYLIDQNKREYFAKQQAANKRLEQSTKELDTYNPNIWKNIQDIAFTQHDVWIASEEEKSYNQNKR